MGVLDDREERAMYKFAVRKLVRHGIGKLNEGDPSFLLKLAAPDAVIAFPGDNTWAAMYRPVQKGRHQHVTHRGPDELRGFADRFVSEGLRFEIEDILVNGPPWRTRVAVRAHDFKAGPHGDEYANRLVAWLEIRWGKMLSWEDYEDTERVTAFDRRCGHVAATAP
jgi:ketosteroid isomerase-like protein